MVTVKRVRDFLVGAAIALATTAALASFPGNITPTNPNYAFIASTPGSGFTIGHCLSAADNKGTIADAGSACGGGGGGCPAGLDLQIQFDASAVCAGTPALVTSDDVGTSVWAKAIDEADFTGNFTGAADITSQPGNSLQFQTQDAVSGGAGNFDFTGGNAGSGNSQGGGFQFSGGTGFGTGSGGNFFADTGDGGAGDHGSSLSLNAGGSTAGHPGTAILAGGNAVSSNTAGANVTVKAGNSTGSAAGGAGLFEAGVLGGGGTNPTAPYVQATGSSSTVGGNLVLRSGDGISLNNASNFTAGNITITAGEAGTVGQAGNITITAGDSDPNGHADGISGNLELYGGDNQGATASAGHAYLIGGCACTGSLGSGGAVLVKGGNGGANGGDVTIAPGQGSGSGNHSGTLTIQLTPGFSTAGNGNMKFVNLPTSDPSVSGALWLNGGLFELSGATNQPTSALTSAHLFVGNASNVATDRALSGDCTMANTGAITCTKTNSVSFGTSATVNTGTSGATIPLLNGVNTYSSASTFSSTITNTGIGSDATHTDATVCEDTTTHLFLAGSGTAGICLGTSARWAKGQIAPIGIDLSKLDVLPILQWHYLKQYGDPDRLHYGPMAEDVAKAAPELVGKTKAGKPMNYDWPALLFAMQARDNQRIAALEKEVRALRSCHYNPLTRC